MQELLRCCAADFYLNRAGELGFFFEEHGYFMLFRYGYDENVKVDLGALHYFQTNQILNVAHHCSFRSHEKPGLHH
jgi:hypothetical protein